MDWSQISPDRQVVTGLERPESAEGALHIDLHLLLPHKDPNLLRILAPPALAL